MSDPIVTQSHSTFALACKVEVDIRADAGRLWKILTTAEDFPRWNSTVSGIEGRIAEGEALRLRVPGTEQVFKPKISGVVANTRMTWSDGFAPMFKGVRTFALTDRGAGLVDFVMEERFTGLILPLIKSALPDFGPIFSRFAADLKCEAERV